LLPRKRDYVNEIRMTLQPGTTLIVTVADAGEAEVAPARNHPGGAPGDPVAAAIGNLARTGNPQVRQIADRLLTLGYTLHPATARTPGKQPENYLRFHDPARPGSAIGYLCPTFFSFTRDRERLEGEGRIVPSTGEIAFDYEDATRGLEIAEMLKG
jgi:hypothetical protein